MSSEPGPSPICDRHDAQDASRSAKRHDSLPRQVFEGNRPPGVSRHPGRPLDARYRRESRLLREAMQPSFADYARAVVRNAAAMAEYLHSEGLRIVSGGTDNHLMLVDLSANGLTGRDAATALERAGIIVNKNTIPFDRNSPFVTSGIRIGTPSVTSRAWARSRCGNWVR